MPSTSELLLMADRRRPRTLQKEIGMSDLGSCRRKVGYKLAGTEPVNPSGSVQAAMGSAIHDLIADTIAGLNLPGIVAEQEVRIAGLLGHFDREEDDLMVDVKTTSSRWLEHIKLHGPEHGHLWQVSCYAAARILQGSKVKRVRIDYLARDTGEEYQWPSPEGAPFNPRHVRDAFEWLENVRRTDVDMLPRDNDPDSVFCQGCPFGGPDGGICWEGYVPERHLRSVQFVEDPDAAKWAEKLWDARERKRAAEKDESEAKQVLDAIRPDGGGRVQVDGFPKNLDFRRNPKNPEMFSLYFVAGGAS
jgi:hypothetical protein